MDTKILPNFPGRRDNLRKLLAKRGLDALVVLSPANRYYLSGFELHDCQCDESSGFLLITADGEDWLFTDSRYQLAAEQIWPAEFLRIYHGDAPKTLRDVLRGYARIAGVEAAYASWDFARKLLAGSSVFGALLKPVKGLVEELRMIKDSAEIEALRQSFALNHQVLAWIEGQVADNAVSGMSESRLAWQIERRFRENGASELAFDVIVAAGEHAGQPHAIPHSSQIGLNRELLIDLGCRMHDYCSDQTRSWWLGSNMPDYFENTLKLVQEAQNTAIELMKPGVCCADVYAAALNVFEKAGVSEHFSHGLGHGLGLQTHELPSLSPRSDMLLQTGMVVTVEPGLYYPQWGGIRWEYAVLLEENGVSIF